MLEVEAGPIHPRAVEPRPACVCDRCERTRIREHFLGAIQMLLAAPGPEGEARDARLAVAGELIRYALRGVFPRNEDIPERLVPTFVDRYRTRCAVAHLLERTGEHELVGDLVRVANRSLVADMLRDARLEAWLAAAHLTPAEAARIQPCYSCPDFSPADECACSLSSFESIFVGTFVKDDATAELQLVVEAAYGESTLVAGDVITSWQLPEEPDLTVSAGTRVLASEEGPLVQVLYPVDGDTVYPIGCRACEPITFAPQGAPLSAFIDVAEGANCYGTFSSLPGWEPQAGDSCNPFSSSTGYGYSVSSSGSGGGGGGDGGGPVTTSKTTDDDGCGIAGASLLDVESRSLLWLLAAGVAVARRRYRGRG